MRATNRGDTESAYQLIDTAHVALLAERDTRTEVATALGSLSTTQIGAISTANIAGLTTSQFSGLTFPKEADGSVIVIYQADPACGVRFRQASNKIPRWPLS